MNHLSESQFRNKISYWRLVLCYAVVMIHAYNNEVYCAQSVSLSGVFVFENFMRTWDAIAVPFFFIISGYLFFRTFHIEQLINKYKSRIRTLLIPYVLWCAIYFIFFVIITNVNVLYQFMNGVRVEFSVAGFVNILIENTYCYHFWYLKVLIFLLLVTPVIYLILEQRVMGAVIILLLLVLNCIGYLDPEKYINTYYIFGAYLAIHHPHLLKAKSKKKIKYAAIILTVLVCLISVVFFINGGHSLYEEMTDCSPLVILLFVVIWYVSDIFSYNGEPKWWMDISFFVYCSFSVILEGVEKIFLKVFGISDMLALVDYLVMPLLTYVVCVGCAYLLRKTKKLYSILAGGR